MGCQQKNQKDDLLYPYKCIEWIGYQLEIVQAAPLLKMMSI